MVGDKFKSKSGEFLVVKYSQGLYLCRFIDTGYETYAQATQIRRGQVKDKLFPSLFGVGVFGDGDRKGVVNGKTTKEYMFWHGMHRRCYDPKYHEIYPSYIDCEVREEWQNFQVFCDWYDKNKPTEQGRWELDKDILVEGNRIYSPDACVFVRSAENNEKCRAKVFKFKNPNGEVVEIYNLKKFCDENGLQSANMYKVMRGDYTHHKGWTNP